LYRLYIDESGDHSYNQMNQISHRYLCLLGVWFRLEDHYLSFSDRLEALKREVFGPHPDNPVVLHRSKIINRRGPFGRLRDEALGQSFDEGLIECVRAAEFKSVCVVIDKKTHLGRYTSPFHPYHYCLTALLERYPGWLNHRNAVGDALAESRGGEEDLQLKQAYRRAYESGTSLIPWKEFQRTLTSKDIKLKRKRDNIAGLQLADIAAHPLKQQLLAERKIIEPPAGTFGARLAAVMAGKLNAHENTGRVEGYGKVWL